MTDVEKLRRAVEDGEFWGDVGTLGPILVREIVRLRADLADSAAESEAVQAMLARVDRAAHAHLAAVGRPLAFGYNFGEHALAVGGELARLREEVARLRGERDAACRMLAKARWKGPWTLTPAEWVAKGRIMAGLPAEPAGGDERDTGGLAAPLPTFAVPVTVVFRELEPPLSDDADGADTHQEARS